MSHVAIDRDTLEVLGTGDYRALSVLTVVKERANVTIAYAAEHKTYSAFTRDQLQRMYTALCKEQFIGEYIELLQAVRALVLRLTPVPFTEEQLNAAAEKKFGPEKFETPAPRKKVPRVVAERKPVDASAIARPKQGSLTGRVWDICDEAARQSADKKTIKQVVLDIGRSEGINDSTISVQFGKWFAVVGSTLDRGTG